jgi:hypothetical protein
MNINSYISYTEATYSDVAKRNNIKNEPTAEQLVKMKLLAEKVFEPLREHFGVSIFISSFFRSAELNKKLKGAKNSQHMLGEAMDIDGDIYGGVTNKQIFDYIKDNLDFDQLILENVSTDGTGGWVHCSYKEFGNRGEILIMTIKNGKNCYEKYV